MHPHSQTARWDIMQGCICARWQVTPDGASCCMQVSDACLTLGRLSMERFARRLSEAPRPQRQHRALHAASAGGELSMHSVADMARYMQRHFWPPCDCRADRLQEHLPDCEIVIIGMKQKLGFYMSRLVKALQSSMWQSN